MWRFTPLRFFFRVTLNHPEMGRHLTLVPLPERLRVVLSEGEVAQLLEAAPGVKYKAAFSVAYGAVCVSMLRVANLASGAGIRNPSQKRALDERLIKTNWQIGNTPWGGRTGQMAWRPTRPSRPIGLWGVLFGNKRSIQ